MSAMNSMNTRKFGLSIIAGFALAITLSAAAVGQDSEVRTIKIATAAESKPLSWGALGAEPQGYEPDILKAIDEKLPQYVFEMEGAADIAQETGLVTGKYDMVTGGYYRSTAREEQFLIPQTPIGVSMMKIYSRTGSGIDTVEDLVGKRLVPVTAAGGVYRFITRWQEENPDFKFDVPTSSAGIPFPNRMREVNDGRYDALILPSNLGQQEVIQNLSLDLQTSEPISTTNTYILIRRSEENQALLEAVNGALAELKADGTLDELSMKWFGEDVIQFMQ